MTTTKKPCAACAQPDAPNVVRIEAEKGTTYQIGDVLVTPETLGTLRRLAEYNEDGFLATMLFTTLEFLINNDFDNIMLADVVALFNNCYKMGANNMQREEVCYD